MLYHRPAALWLGLAAGLVRGAAVSKRAAIDDCLAAANVPTNEPGSDEWKADTLPFNDRIHFTPAAIAVPTTIEHIQAAVKCAAEAGDVKVSAKSGGHSYASLGLGGEDGHLVVQLDRMYNISLNTETNIATVQPGARLGHVATELWNQGKRAISAGTCPGVGVSGHSLHGGFGMSSHKYGLATDWIVGLQVVLADGSLVAASATENAELFWGLKGAGSNFGIVASYEFDTFAAPDEVTYFSMPFRWNATTAGRNLAALEAYARDTMPADLNMRMFTSGFSSQLEGLFYGDAAGLRAALAPLLNATTPALRIAQAVNTTWMEAFAHYANAPTNPTHPYESQETFYSKSLTLKSLEGEAGANFVDYWFGHTQDNRRSWWLQLDFHGGRHSAVSHGPRAALSSYAHRDALWLVQFYDRVYAGAYPDAGFGFLDGWVANVTRPLARADWGMYINYADSRLSRDDAMQNYWGHNLARLQALKADVDRDQLFYYPQAFPPAEAS